MITFDPYIEYIKDMSAGEMARIQLLKDIEKLKEVKPPEIPIEMKDEENKVISNAIPEGYRKIEDWERFDSVCSGDKYFKSNVGFVDCVRSIGKPFTHSFKRTVLLITKRPLTTPKPTEWGEVKPKKTVNKYEEYIVQSGINPEKLLSRDELRVIQSDIVEHGDTMQIRGGGEFGSISFYLSRGKYFWHLVKDSSGEYCLVPVKK